MQIVDNFLFKIESLRYCRKILKLNLLFEYFLNFLMQVLGPWLNVGAKVYSADENVQSYKLPHESEPRLPNIIFSLPEV